MTEHGVTSHISPDDRVRRGAETRILCAGLILLALSSRTASAADATPDPAANPAGIATPLTTVSDADRPLDYALVITGRELLEGAYADAHTQYITRTLRGLGLHCLFSVCVDDDQSDIGDAVREAAARVRLVIVTGGLGPTENDVTRQALSQVTGVPLREHPDVLREMERRTGVARDQLRPNMRRQTLLPTRGTYLKNVGGSSLGLVFDWDDRVVVALPGPPRELQPMVRQELVPFLSRRFGTRSSGCSITIRFVGIGQSQIDHTMEQHAPLPPGTLVSSQFEGSRVDFTFSLIDDTPENQARLAKLQAQTTACLGEYIYAYDEKTTLEQHVASLLAQRHRPLAIAEIGSGGCLIGALGGEEAARSYLAGGFVAGTDQRMRALLRVPDDQWSAAVSPADRTQRLAHAIAAETSAQLAFVVSDVSQNPDGAAFVDVVFRQPDGSLETQRLSLRTGTVGRQQLTTQLLDRLRRWLQ